MRRRSKRYSPRPYAIRKPKGYLAQGAGDLAEVDTVDLRPLPGVTLKHFTARDVGSRWDVLGVYTRAQRQLRRSVPGGDPGALIQPREGHPGRRRL